VKIALIISSLRGGGAERVMTDMANYWVKKGWDISIITLSGPEVDDAYPLDTRINRLHLSLEKISGSIIQKLINNISRIRRLRNTLDDIDPQAVISFMDTVNVITILSSFKKRWKVIVSERTNPSQNPLINSFWRFLRKYTYSYSNFVVAQTKGASLWLIEQGFNNVTTIPNSIRILPVIKPECQRDNIILAAGRFDTYKGFDLLIRSCGEIFKENKEWSLVILGDGPERNKLEQLSKNYNIEDQVSLPGRVRDIEEWMKNASIFASCSRIEGFPNVVLEAMGMGCAVISTDCNYGPSDIIENNLNGLLFPVDSADDLTDAIVKLISDSELRKSLGREAIKIRERYSQKNIMAIWENVLYD
jgi:GalNAc-alpha-(1->4)-GalNAc-alpha-(1->3)-diNAcBac-PP-undecaprenol alpha-1,4-N-acetyl-D-galactosaminyltransferase